MKSVSESRRKGDGLAGVPASKQQEYLGSSAPPLAQEPYPDVAETLLEEAREWTTHGEDGFPERSASAYRCMIRALLEIIDKPRRTRFRVHGHGPLEIVLDGPPGPHAGRFVEAEVDGRSVRAGEWVDRGDGTWALRIDPAVASPTAPLDVCPRCQRSISGALKRETAMDILGLACGAVVALGFALAVLGGVVIAFLWAIEQVLL